MLITTGACCCPTGEEFLYIGQGRFVSPFDNRILKLGLDGSNMGALPWSYNTSTDGLHDMCVDPITGNVYVMAYNRIIAISSAGVELWNIVDNTVPTAGFATACDKFGHVYSSSNTIVTQRNASNGSSNWSYFSPGPPFMQINGICTDQFGNVYCTGPRLNQAGTPTDNLYSLDIHGSLRWSITLPGEGIVVPPNRYGPNHTPQRIAMNLLNTELIVVKEGDVTIPREVEIRVNPANGVILGSNLFLHARLAVSYDILDNYFTGQDPNDVSGEAIRKNGTSFYAPINENFGLQAMTNSHTDLNTYFTKARQTIRAYTIAAIDASGNELWTFDTGTIYRSNAIESSLGRIGAYGFLTNPGTGT